MKKNERGSIIIYVLCSCLLMLVILVGVFMRSQAKLVNQKRQQEIIEQQYDADEYKMQEIYEETVRNMPNNGGE